MTLPIKGSTPFAMRLITVHAQQRQCQARRAEAACRRTPDPWQPMWIIEKYFKDIL